MIKNEAKTLTPVNHPDFDYPGPDILDKISSFKIYYICLSVRKRENMSIQLS